MNTSPDSLLLESKSNFLFSKTIELLLETIQAQGWKLIATHDMQETLRKNGINVLPVTVIEICHPQLAASLLKPDDQRYASLLMPCRISVYEKSDGKTYISRLNPLVFAKKMGGVIAEVMPESFYKTEDILKSILL